MPPTIANVCVGNERSHNSSSRPSRSSRINYATLASVGLLVEGPAEPKRKTLTTSSAPDLSYKLIPCKIILERLSPEQLRLCCSTDFDSQNSSESSDTASTTDRSVGKQAVANAQSDPSPVERFSNITKRTKGRRTVVNAAKRHTLAAKQRHTTSGIIEVSHGSIITLDETTDDCSASQEVRKTVTDARGASQVPKKSTRHSAVKRKNDSTVATLIDVSPPKIPARENRISEIVELSPGPDRSIGSSTDKSTAEPAARHVTRTTDDVVPPVAVAPLAKKINNNLFRTLIVSVKRIVPALTDAGLRRLKYPELETAPEKRNTVFPRVSVPSVRGSSGGDASINPTRRARSRLTLSIKPQIVVPGAPAIAEDHEPARDIGESPPEVRETRKAVAARLDASVKPQIVISAPIIEPEQTNQGKRAVDSNANNLAAAPPAGGLLLGVSNGGGVFKKLQRDRKLPSLSLLVEDEEEDGPDVYEFMSHSQSNGKGQQRKGRKVKQKKNGAIKPKQKKEKVKKPTTGRKPVPNPFGCKGANLARVIKQIGGGPVRSPAAVNYVVNLDLPETPEPASVRQASTVSTNVSELPLPVPSAPPVRLRPANPAVQRLKEGLSLLPQTSTPIAGRLSVPVSDSPPQNPTSPWRLQDNLVVPRTSYVPRNKEMLPSYESLADDSLGYDRPAIAHNRPPVSALVTERRKPPATQQTVNAANSSPATPSTALAEFPAGSIVSEKNFREIERMYDELKATSEMSEKLLTVMRRYKAKLANHPASPPQKDRREYESNMKEACAKLRKWYERSIKSLNHSMHIISRIQRTTDSRAAACPSPSLTTEQQRTVDNFNHSTNQFRTMIDDLQAAMNDSNGENRSPAVTDPSKKPHEKGKVADVIELPQRTTNNVKGRNPLAVLNFVPLSLRTSPLISPLASTNTDRPVALDGLRKGSENVPSSDGTVRRELRYAETEKENGTMADMAKEVVEVAADDSVDKSPAAIQSSTVADEVEAISDVAANEVVEWQCDQTTAHNSVAGVPRVEEIVSETDCSAGQSSTDLQCDQPTAHNPDAGVPRVEEIVSETDCSAGQRSTDLFGFEEDSCLGSSQEAQVTIPMPLNITAETLHRRMQNAKRLIPKGSVFRQQAKATTNPSGGGPTRFPTAHLRVITSPTKRPLTLREFVASTPRAELSQLATGGKSRSGGGTPAAAAGSDGQSSTLSAAPSTLEAPDVSAIESPDVTAPARPTETGLGDQTNTGVPEVVLFDTPEESRINRSAHQRTYARIPRRKKKINIYLANLGLDDDDDDEEEQENDPVELSSDSESESAKERKKKKKKAQRAHHRRKAKPVEETKEFKEFVESFNTMCEEVNRFEVIIE